MILEQPGIRLIDVRAIGANKVERVVEFFFGLAGKADNPQGAGDHAFARQHLQTFRHGFRSGFLYHGIENALTRGFHSQARANQSAFSPGMHVIRTFSNSFVGTQITIELIWPAQRFNAFRNRTNGRVAQRVTEIERRPLVTLRQRVHLFKGASLERAIAFPENCLRTERTIEWAPAGAGY